MINKKALIYLPFIATWVVLGAGVVKAQSGSTDVLPEGRFYLEVGLNAHLAPFREGGYKTYVPRVVAGVKRDVEVGLNLEFSNPNVPDQGVELQPNAKWQFYGDESRGVAASVGGALFVPVARRAGTDTFGMVYASVSKQLPGRFGPRLTGGGFALIGRESGYGARAGHILGYDQPLHRRVSAGVSWWGGSSDRFGYVTPGLTFALTSRSQLSVGYSIGNRGRGNNELAAAYGVQF